MIDCRLLAKSSLVQLKTPGWGNHRKTPLPDETIRQLISRLVDESDEAFEERFKKARKMLACDKRLVISEEYDALMKFLAGVRTSFQAQWCNPAFMGIEGVYSIKNEAVAAATAELTKKKAELAKDFLPPFLDAFEERVLEAKRILNGQFRPTDYPGCSLDASGNLIFDRNIMAQRFDIEWLYVAFDVPQGLPPEVREAEEAKLKARYEEAANKITAALYSGLQEIVDKLVDRMSPGADGKARTFQYTTIGNLMEFIGTFKAKNTFDDERLASIVGKAEAVLSSITGGTVMAPDKLADTLRDYEGLRAKAAKGFGEVKAVLDAAVQDLPLRAIDFKEE